MAAAKKAGAAQPRSGVSWAEACRDVLTAAINKGQLPGLFCGLIVLAIVVRMPEGELPSLAHRILDHLRDGAMLGWALFAAMVAVTVVYGIRTRALIQRLTDQYPAKLARDQAEKDRAQLLPPKGDTK